MNAIKLLIVWLWVAVPLGWGVMKSIDKSKPLFRDVTAAVKDSSAK